MRRLGALRPQRPHRASTITSMDYRARQLRFAEELERGSLDAFLITRLPNIRYLCGFTGSAGVLAYRQGKFGFFTDGRYTVQARSEVKGASVTIAKGPASDAALAWVLGCRADRVGIEAEHVTVAMRGRLEALLHGKKKRLVPVSGLVERLRLVKDADELERIRKAVYLGSSLFETAVSAIRPKAEEAAVAAELEYAARRAGAAAMSFETIVAAGPNAALPHWRASSQPIPNTGFVVLDFGVILSGYCSDMTRTVWVGKEDAWARQTYEAVLESQLAGIQAVRPGATAGEVDKAARRVLHRSGLAKYFTHSTGHGVGLEIHEAPRLARGQTEVLQQGMVVTIEPGVYIPGKGGVRIEDMVAVTATGCEVLTPTPKRFITV